MTTLNRKKTFSKTKSWISYTKNYEIQQQKAFSSTYSNLYHYAANNPVRYIDPDGKKIFSRVNSRIANSLANLYSKSNTFRNLYKKLASENNTQGKELFVIVTDFSDKYAGNTQSQDSCLDNDASVLVYDGEENYHTENVKKGTEVQAIFINIDLARIDKKKLDLELVLAEEFAHGTEASNQGTEKWNERANEESNLPYQSRPEEIRAKKIAIQIIQEVRNNEN